MTRFTRSSGQTHTGSVRSQIEAQLKMASDFMLRLISITPEAAFVDRAGVYLRPAFCPVYARALAKAQRPILQR